MLQSFCQQRIHLVELGTLPNQMVKSNKYYTGCKHFYKFFYVYAFPYLKRTGKLDRNQICK